MKDDIGYRHIFWLISAMSGFVTVSGAEITSKSVCLGDSVEAFQNITFNNCSSVISLSMKGEIDTLIAMWSFENCSRKEAIVLDYMDRVFLYGNGSILIHTVHTADQATYIVNCRMENIYMEYVVHIQVMAAPSKDCIPNILHLGSRLFASLKAPFCGKPVATLFWKGHGDVPNSHEPVLKLNPGNKDGTYYACLEGPALMCVRNELDYCSTITTRDESPPILETWDVRIAIFIVLGIVLGIALILATSVILIRKYCKTSKDEHKANQKSEKSTARILISPDTDHNDEHHELLPRRSLMMNGVPQPVQVTSHRDSLDSTSYQLMWDKPDDGGYPLIKYIIRYCEVEIIPDRTEYELSKYLTPLEYVDNIPLSAVSYKLSALTPHRYYFVEIQAIHTQGQTSKSFIFKTKEGIPQPVQVTSHRDSPDSISYKLMWDKPDDGGSPLIKYIIRYCQMTISPEGAEYELSKPLNPLEISPSDESYTLSSLKPGSFYQVEVQAVNTMGMSSRKFIFKTKDMEPDLPLPVQHAPFPTSQIIADETNPKLRARLSKNIMSKMPRLSNIQFATSNDEHNLNTKMKKSTEISLSSHDSASKEEQVALLTDSVD